MRRLHRKYSLTQRRRSISIAWLNVDCLHKYIWHCHFTYLRTATLSHIYPHLPTLPLINIATVLIPPLQTTLPHSATQHVGLGLSNPLCQTQPSGLPSHTLPCWDWNLHVFTFQQILGIRPPPSIFLTSFFKMKKIQDIRAINSRRPLLPLADGQTGPSPTRVDIITCCYHSTAKPPHDINLPHSDDTIKPRLSKLSSSQMIPSPKWSFLVNDIAS